MTDLIHLPDPLAAHRRLGAGLRQNLGKLKRWLAPQPQEQSVRDQAPVLNYRRELKGAEKGGALLSYLVAPFHQEPGEALRRDYSNWVMSLEIANALNRLGYAVDVIDYRDSTFVSERKYDVFIGMTGNFTRLLSFMSKDTRLIYWATRTDPACEIEAIRQRQAALQRRKGTIFPIPELIFPLLESADYYRAEALFVIGNEVTRKTFRTPARHVICFDNPALPLPGQGEQPRSYPAARTNFLFLSSWLLLRKGFDLVLEAFAARPDLHLWIAAPVAGERAFLVTYRRELFQTPNIHTLGWVPMQSDTFQELCRRCAFLVFPSCSEGMSGSVINGMIQGLIPICTPEAGVDMDDFGFLLEQPTPEALGDLVTQASQTSPEELQARSARAQNTARERYSVEKFRDKIESSLRTVLSCA